MRDEREDSRGDPAVGTDHASGAAAATLAGRLRLAARARWRLTAVIITAVIAVLYVIEQTGPEFVFSGEATINATGQIPHDTYSGRRVSEEVCTEISTPVGQFLVDKSYGGPVEVHIREGRLTGYLYVTEVVQLTPADVMLKEFKAVAEEYRQHDSEGARHIPASPSPGPSGSQ